MLSKIFIVLMLCGAEPNEDLTCLRVTDGGPPPREIFYARLQEEAYAALDRRLQAYGQLDTPEKIHARQKQLKDFLWTGWGAFPNGRRLTRAWWEN